jgi:hypothetical protein
MRFEDFDVAARIREERNLVFGVSVVVHSAHQLDVRGEIAEEAGVEMQTPAASLMATGLALLRHIHCHRKWCATAPLAAVPYGLPVRAQIACARRVVVVVVAAPVARDDIVAEMVVGAQAFGGDSSSARCTPECHDRRTRIRCIQGHQNGERGKSLIMQVAEAERYGAMVCEGNVPCEVNEWIGEWRTAGQVNQCMRVRVAVLLPFRDRCRSNSWVLFDRSDARRGDARTRCSRLGSKVVFVLRWVCRMQDRARRLYRCYARRNGIDAERETRTRVSEV